jgi:hypothetical protein
MENKRNISRIMEIRDMGLVLLAWLIAIALIVVVYIKIKTFF